MKIFSGERAGRVGLRLDYADIDTGGQTDTESQNIAIIPHTVA